MGTQLAARQSLADALAARGYDVTVDARVSIDDEAGAVHVDATEDLLDDRLIADVHETPDVAGVRRLCRAARGVDAEPVLLSTSGSLPPAADELVRAEAVTVLHAGDRELTREYEVADPAADPPSLFDRLRAVVDPEPRGRS